MDVPLHDPRLFAIHMHRHELAQARRCRVAGRADRHAMALVRARCWRLKAGNKGALDDAASDRRRG